MSTSLRPGSQDADNRPVHAIPFNGIRPSPSMPPPRQPPFSRDPGINTSNQIEDPLEWNMNVEDDSSRFFDFDEWLSLGASASTSGSADKDRTPSQQPKDSSKQGNAIQSSTSAHPTTPDWGREATWEDIASSYDQHGAGVGASDHGFARSAEASWYPLTVSAHRAPPCILRRWCSTFPGYIVQFDPSPVARPFHLSFPQPKSARR